MELKKYFAVIHDSDYYNNLTDGDPISIVYKVEDVKQFLGIGDCYDCNCYDGEYGRCNKFGELFKNRHPDCIKTFGE